MLINDKFVVDNTVTFYIIFLEHYRLNLKLIREKINHFILYINVLFFF